MIFEYLQLVTLPFKVSRKEQHSFSRLPWAKRLGTNAIHSLM